MIGLDRRLVEFITHGISSEAHAAIGDLPTGRGVLGLLIERSPAGADARHHAAPAVRTASRPTTRRCTASSACRCGSGTTSTATSTWPRSAAPPSSATTTNRSWWLWPPRRASRSTTPGCTTVAQRRQRWLAAAAEITELLLGRVRRTEALKLVARRAREVAGAELVLVLLHDEEADRLTVEVADAGRDEAGRLAGAVLPADGRSFDEALDRPPTGASWRAWPRRRAWPVPVPDRPATVVPLASAEALPRPAGHGRCRAASARPGEDLAMLSSVRRPGRAGAGTGAGPGGARAVRHPGGPRAHRPGPARRGDPAAVRHRACSCRPRPGWPAGPEVADRVNAAVDDLDATIRDIRSAIFELRTPMSADAARARSGSSSRPPPSSSASDPPWSWPGRWTVRSPGRASRPICWPCCGRHCPMRCATPARRGAVSAFRRRAARSVTVADNGVGVAGTPRAAAWPTCATAPPATVVRSSVTSRTAGTPIDVDGRGWSCAGVADAVGSGRSPEQLGGQDGGLGPPLQAELGQQAGHVVLHRLLGEEHLRRRSPGWSAPRRRAAGSGAPARSRT